MRIIIHVGHSCVWGSTSSPTVMAAVSVEKNGCVFTIILHRPKRRNAVDGATAKLLSDAFRQFEADENARVAVLYGDGGTFCAGADLKALGQSNDPSSRSQSNRLAAVGQGDSPMGPARMAFSKPVIAAIAGHAVAGGLELALMCDMRVAEEDAVLGVFCRRFGVPLIDGGTVRLPRIVGMGRAMDLILTGRPVGAQEALQMGLINRIVPKFSVRKQAERLAAEIAQHPQECMKADRNSAYHQHDKSVFEALKYEFKNAMDRGILTKESIAGAQRFSAGSGRHGVPVHDAGVRTNIRAVLFDLGGVIFDSPINIIAQYGKEVGLTRLNSSFKGSKYWHLLETGKMCLDEFYKPFEQEVHEHSGVWIDAKELFDRVAKGTRVRALMIALVLALRQGGYLVGAITNNWRPAQHQPAFGTGAQKLLESTFMTVVQSCEEGIRKPDRRLYLRACKRLGVSPTDALFLDDMGLNCKTARQLGMQTIKVSLRDHKGEQAVRAVQTLLPQPVDVLAQLPKARRMIAELATASGSDSGRTLASMLSTSGASATLRCAL